VYLYVSFDARLSVAPRVLSDIHSQLYLSRVIIHDRDVSMQQLVSINDTIRGAGFLNSAINALPFELHIPGYQFCGPGTRLRERLARGERGINPLDAACREHDIAYSRNKELSNRHIADQLLAKKSA